MAGRKPARMYRQVKSQSYTRREYMGGVPHSRIAQFEMGNKKGEFPVEMTLIAEGACQIKHTAMEAARIAANRYIQKRAGNLGYFLKINTYPHDAAFGKAVGTAARVRSGQTIMTLRVNKANFYDAKKALWKAGLKVPTVCRVNVVRGEATL
ncbi:MAG: hypothetical protein AYK23_00895 [Candidatus Proteinoplasmatales archaeon SG8-5]|nr:MAG: hypothetical protein AYK23_00895 [Candidatus Proteinoplasmatales archaeon SG8-5]